MRSTEHDLHMAMADRQKAMLAGDADSIDRLTAEEYVQTDIFGHVQDKSAWLREYFLPLAALMKAGKFHWDLYEEKDVAVHMFSDTAVVTGSLHMKGTGARVAGRTWQEAPNTSIEANLRFTRVWIKRDGAWRVAALHNALTPMTAANGDAPSHQP
jgi:ketosteroid isomerase-like protein